MPRRVSRWQLCTFFRRVEASDAYGNPVTGDWMQFWEDWGNLRLETGAERLRGGRMSDAVSGNLRVHRYAETEEITTADSVVIDEVAYAILGIVSPPGAAMIEFTLQADPDA